MAELLNGRAFVITGGKLGLRFEVSFVSENLADVGPDLLSLFEYTAAIRNLKTDAKFQYLLKCIFLALIQKLLTCTHVQLLNL
jgi:hypothetical protein